MYMLILYIKCMYTYLITEYVEDTILFLDQYNKNNILQEDVFIYNFYCTIYITLNAIP